MKIGVISDTHDNLGMIDRAVEVFRSIGVDTVIHAGDFVAPFAAKRVIGLGVPICAVFGNCDGERKGLSRLIENICDPPHLFELGGRRILVAHSRAVVDEGEIARADVFIYGHDHTAHVSGETPLVLNPGECCGYVKGRASVAVLDTDSLEAYHVNL